MRLVLLFHVELLIFLHLIHNSSTSCFREPDGPILICSEMSKEDFFNEFEPTIQTNFWVYNEEIEKINLESINLITINKYVFDFDAYNFKNTISLRIDNCAVIYIESDSFAKLTSLKYLTLRKNQLTQYNGDFLDGLSHLIKLDLSENQIENFYMNCRNHENLQEINLNNNNLKYLPDFGYCHKLVTLKLEECKINEIDLFFLVNFPNLKYLYLRNNYLKNFNFLTRVNQIILMDVGNNSISFDNYYNFYFFDELRIHSINLTHNKLKILNSRIFHRLQNITNLDLSNMKIDTIQDNALSNLSILSQLNLNNNSINKLPCNLLNIDNNLTELVLSNNKLKEILICSFYKYKNLIHLDLKFNEITSFPIGTFSALKKLEFLDISNNQLINIDENIINPLENLKTFYLNGNKMRNPNIINIIDHLSYTKEIDISGNYWSCFVLSRIKNYLRHRSINLESKILDFNSDNIDGIHCSIETNNISEENNFPYTNDYTLSYLIAKLQNTNNKIITKLEEENKNYNKIYTLFTLIVIIIILMIISIIIVAIINVYKRKKDMMNKFSSMRYQLELLNRLQPENNL